MDKLASAEKLSNLLAMLTALERLHQTAHWQSSGENFYGDHGLFERLYASMGGEADGLAEKMVALYGVASVDAVVQGTKVTGLLTRWSSPKISLVQRSFNAENEFQKALDATLDLMQSSGELGLGLENFLQGLADKHDTATYLLKQRLAGATKLAARYLGRQ